MKRESLITKLVAFMLCVMMVVGCLPVSAYAANDWEGDIDVVETEPPVGSQQNPATVEWVWNEAYTEATATVTVPANSTMYFQDRSISAVNVLTANGETVEVTYGTPRMSPSTWNIPNTTETDVEYTLVLTYAVGSMENPYAASLYENVVSVEAGDKDGYYMTYTAEYTGTLVVTISTEAAGWSYVINNNTAYIYGDTQWSDSDPVVNPAEIAVTEGDEIQIIVNTYDPADSWNSPAGEINAYLEYKPGSCEAFPIFLAEQVNNVTNAGTVYYKGYFAGMNVVITGEGEFTVISDGEEIAAVDGKVEVSYPAVMGRPMPNSIVIVGDGEFTIAASYPLGTMENPAVAVLGDNTASIAAGGSEYVWNYTAEKDGDLVITVSTASGNWQYVVNNMTTYVYGDTQWSDSDPVVNPATITVKAGDVIEIKALTYDPENPWAAPAGDVIVNLAYEVEEVYTVEFTGTIRNSANFVGAVELNQYSAITFSDNLTQDYIFEHGGLLAFDGEVTEAEATIENCEKVTYGLKLSNGLYGGTTAGIPAAEYGKALSLRLFVELPNGEFVYGGIKSYSVKQYCEGRITATSSAQTMKNLAAATLHYGAMAQINFNKDTDQLANNGLTGAYAQTAFAYDASYIDALNTNASFAKAGTGTFAAPRRTLNFVGAVEIVHQYQPSGIANMQKIEMLVWKNVTGELNEADADVITMESAGSGWYKAATAGIPAAEYGYTFILCAKVTDADGNAYYSDLSFYSPETYAANQISKTSTSENTKNVCKAMVVFGQMAKIHFGK